ncbi:MAG TPA: zinc ribbon domain-containing protein [Desulfobacteraceae bacterium]|nr:zinc ribbon domain-containing protein [Desulfobacteraceae bacterium]
MELRVEQRCPQCGAPVVLAETDRLLTCPYCGIKNFLRSRGAFRYLLPAKTAGPERGELLYVPYLRLKSTLYSVSENGIAHRIIDTTRLGHPLPGLPPTLGVRPQAMKFAPIAPETGGSFLRMSVKAGALIENGAGLDGWSGNRGRSEYHRAAIGDTFSLIYLPLDRDISHLIDAVTGNPLIELEHLQSFSLRGVPFNPRWQVGFLPALCPRCGWSLDGEGDCLVLTCDNCDSAREVDDHGLRRMEWLVQPGGPDTSVYLAFWKITAAVSAPAISSFGDFIERCNQPLLPGPHWRDQAMSYWIPAFKVRPRTFLRLARAVTVSQWRLRPEEGHVVPGLFPVTLAEKEARQAVKVTLAACAVSPDAVHPALPGARLKVTARSLVFLPFADHGYELVQPHTGASVPGNVLRFGRKL